MGVLPAQVSGAPGHYRPWDTDGDLVVGAKRNKPGPDKYYIGGTDSETGDPEILGGSPEGERQCSELERRAAEPDGQQLAGSASITSVPPLPVHHDEETGPSRRMVLGLPGLPSVQGDTPGRVDHADGQDSR